MSSNHIYTCNDRTPYTYLIGWSAHNKWYYGVRYGKHCHPLDLWQSYFTSSKEVIKFRNLHGDPDIIKIRKTFKSVVHAKNYEDKVLRRMKVNLLEKWLNIKADSFKGLDVTKVKYKTGLNNPIHKYLETNMESFKKKISEGTKIGQANSPKSLRVREENTKRFIENNPGKNKSAETTKRMSESQKIRMSNVENRPIGNKNGMYGKTHSDERKQEISIRTSAQRKLEKYLCPFCDKIIGTAANWHTHLRKKHLLTDDEIKIYSEDCRLSAA